MNSEFVNIIEYATYYLGEEMEITSGDELFTKLTGYTIEDINRLSLKQEDLIFDEDKEAYFALVYSGLAKSGEAFIEHRIKCKDGSAKFVFCLGHVYPDESGKMKSVIRVTDMTSMISMRIQADAIRKENEEELEAWMEVANLDELTGTLRRAAFRRKIKSIDNITNCAVLMIDIDDFKNINDTCGHDVGDKVLQGVAKVMSKVLRENDLVCRLGGDEFAIFLNGVSDRENAVEICQRIIAEVDKLDTITEGKAPVHISVGAKLVDMSSESLGYTEVYTAADEALYVAKREGKNRYIIR